MKRSNLPYPEQISNSTQHQPDPPSKENGPKYSLIIPIYNEEEVIAELYRRTSAVIDRLEGSTELIFINDGSKDRSLAMLRELHCKDQRVCYLSLARNFGHQIAVTAGLHITRGEAVVILDADLQDPPELIPELIKEWQQGYKVVYAQRARRKQEKLLKRFSAYVFYRFLQRIANVSIPTDTGDFCLIDRQIVDLLNAMPERNRYIRGLRSWVGFQQTAIRFERDPRFSGEAKYTFRKSLSLAMNSLVSFSKVPLQLSTYLGLISAGLAILMILLVLYWRFALPNSPLTGLATIVTSVLFLGAVQLIGIGILGEYVGRIYEEVQGRPLYTLDEIGVPRDQDEN